MGQYNLNRIFKPKYFALVGDSEKAGGIGELFDCAGVDGQTTPPGGARLAILTSGGGSGVRAADTLARYGQAPAPLDSETMHALDSCLPPLGAGVTQSTSSVMLPRSGIAAPWRSVSA